MSDSVFVDTNVLVYAHDLDAGEKHERARNIIHQLWVAKNGFLSTQVLQECYVTFTRRMSHPISKVEARRILQEYFSW